MTDRTCPMCQSRKMKLQYKADGFRVVQCKHCGFVYTSNPETIDQSQETYDDYFQNSKTLHTDTADKADQTAMHVFETRLGAVQKRRANGRLLEIGCGRGYFLNLAQKAGYRVKGIEISPIAAHYAGVHFGLDVDITDFESLELGEEKYDIIVMWHVLEHFRNPLQVLETVYSLLDEKGALFIEVPNLNSLKFKMAAPNKKWQGGNHPRYHMSFFSWRSLGYLLAKTGFKDMENLNLQYSNLNNPVQSVVKSLLNSIHLDSFLSVCCEKG